MRGIFLHKKSPFYWFRYYDALEQNGNKRKEHNTKIRATEADWKRWEDRKPGAPVKLQGTPELWRKVKEMKSALADRRFEADSGARIISRKKLSQGFKEYKEIKSARGIKGELKLKTLEVYELAVEHMIEACGDKFISNYTAEKDYVKLLQFFEARKIGGKKTKDENGEIQIEYRKMSVNSRSIYTRHLKTLWEYFVQKNYAHKNIIDPIHEEEKDPRPIPTEDLFRIIGYLQQREKFQHHYWIIYFMALTGCRPSSAIMTMKEDIDFKHKVIRIPNIKTGKLKGKPFYRFPLYKELEELLANKMGIKDGDTGRLFSQFEVVPENYTWPLSFWNRAVTMLYKAKIIRAEYNLKQIRPTFISFAINTLGLDIYTTSKLADHVDIKTTDDHYVDFKLNNARKILDEFKMVHYVWEGM